MARIVEFQDGAQSETVPTIGNIVASDLVQYVDDATYEANELGSPDGGNIYFNTTDNVIRYYNGTIWQELVDEMSTQAVENKIIDADNNTITNIDNNEIKTAAGIDATKLADGSVTDTEFQHINSVTSNVQDQIDGKIPTAEKGAANGVAELDGAGTVPASQLPSYVDDVLEFADLASFPGTGETGKIYIAIDTNFQYRWTGSVYVDITSKVDSVNAQTGAVTLNIADDVLTTKGDVLSRDGSDLTRIPVGTNGQVLTADSVESSGVKWAAPSSSTTAPTKQIFLTGSGTYIRPAGVVYIEVEVVGAGGGGSGSGGATPGSGSAGTASTFGGGALISGGGGAGGFWANPIGGIGGTAAIGAGPVGKVIDGGHGAGVNGSGIPTFDPGGSGGNSALGGGGSSVGATNSGAGGQGGSITTVGSAGSGGGAGGYVKVQITTPSGSYSYVVGAGGGGGGAGTGAGAATGNSGATGLIVVTEYY